MKYFVIGSGSIGRRRADNLEVLGADVKQYSWRNINLDQALYDIEACNGRLVLL